MKINQINQTNFQGLHVDRSAYKQFGCTQQTFLNNKYIKDCADKFEVVVKKGKKIGTREPDPILFYFGGIFASVLGVSVPSIYNFFVESIDVISTSAPSILNNFLCGIGSAAAFVTGFLTLGRKSIHEYILQAGKGTKTNAFGKTELTGIVSREYHLQDSNDIRDVRNLSGDIIKRDRNDFLDFVDDFGVNKLDSAKNVLDFLNTKFITNNYNSGSCFNYKFEDGNSLLTKFMDIVPTEENQNDYDKIVDIMQEMNDIDYNQQDSNGISVVEKIFNSESKEVLELIKNKNINYVKELDFAFENIQDKSFKHKAKNLQFVYPELMQAINDYNSNLATELIKGYFNSPLCDKQKIIMDLQHVDHRHINTAFDILFNLQNEGIIDNNIRYRDFMED